MYNQMIQIDKERDGVTIQVGLPLNCVDYIFQHLILTSVFSLE